MEPCAVPFSRHLGPCAAVRCGDQDRQLRALGLKPAGVVTSDGPRHGEGAERQLAKEISSPQPFSGNRLTWIPLGIRCKSARQDGGRETVVE